MSFPELVQSYPYLFTNIASFLIFVVGGRFILQRRHWGVMLLCGALNAPCFPLLIFFENEYWNPVRLGGWILGVEDILCSFMVAVMSWFVFALLFSRRITIPERPKILWPRYRIIAGVSVLIFLFCYWVGLKSMTSLVLTCAIVACLVIMIKRELWPLALGGGIGFGVIYLVMVRIYFFIWPDFVLQWNAQAFWGCPVGGIPMGEIVWALAFGVYWPLFMMYVLDIRYGRSAFRAAS
jgi:hypothetical protein